MSEYQKMVNDIFFNEDFHDLLFKDGIKPFQKDEIRFERALLALNYPNGKQIYELGPYPGTGMYYFGANNKIIGLGNSSPDFQNKVRKIGHHLISVNFDTNNDIKHLIKADIVLVMEVLEHIRMPYQFLQNLVKLLKPGGMAYLTTNNRSYIGYIIKLLFSKPILDPIDSEGSFYPGHCRYYGLCELNEIFVKMGFTILQANHVNFLPNAGLYKNVVFGALKNFLVKSLPIRFSTHIEILIKKNE